MCIISHRIVRSPLHTALRYCSLSRITDLASLVSLQTISMFTSYVLFCLLSDLPHPRPSLLTLLDTIARNQTHISNTGFMGSTVGQAHLLSDLIDNLELEGAVSSSSAAVPHYRQRTFEYSLGREHALFSALNQ